MPSVPSRPRLLHERLAEQLLEGLQYAQTVDLTGWKWIDLAALRGDLARSHALQRATGPVADDAAWQAARARVEGRMAELEAQAAKRRRARAAS